jgi:hypothetical protein
LKRGAGKFRGEINITAIIGKNAVGGANRRSDGSSTSGGPSRIRNFNQRGLKTVIFNRRGRSFSYRALGFANDPALTARAIVLGEQSDVAHIAILAGTKIL